jgi:hypothetical protein
VTANNGDHEFCINASVILHLEVQNDLEVTERELGERIQREVKDSGIS